MSGPRNNLGGGVSKTGATDGAATEGPGGAGAGVAAVAEPKAEAVKAEAVKVDEAKALKLAAERAARYAQACDALNIARSAMEAEFAAVEKAMSDKRGAVAALEKGLRKSFNTGDADTFYAAVKAAEVFVAAQGVGEKA